MSPVDREVSPVIFGGLYEQATQPGSGCLGWQIDSGFDLGRGGDRGTSLAQVRHGRRDGPDIARGSAQGFREIPVAAPGCGVLALFVVVQGGLPGVQDDVIFWAAVADASARCRPLGQPST